VVAAVLGFGLFLTLGGVTQLINTAFGVWFTEVFLFLGLGWVLLRHAGWRPAVYTGLVPVTPAPAVFGFLVGVANFFALVVPIQYTAQRVAPQWLRDMFDSSRLFESLTPVELAVIIGGVSIAAPLCEEFFFRGLLQKGLTPRAPASPVRALVVTAVVFSAFHLDPVGFFARVDLGLLFGWLFLRTGSLWPGMAAHAANNLVSTGLYLVASRSGAAAEAASTETTSPLVVLYLATAGFAGLLLLRTASEKLPSVWGRGAGATPEEARAPGSVPSLPRIMLPWVVVATLSLVLLGALDARGISLSIFDIQHPLPKLTKNAPPGLLAEREALHGLRIAARRGKITMEAYEEERLRQVKAHAQERK
jgi:membrane protease YdiL (CAAX protease family)